jgi:hypothetical protein
MSRYLVLWHFLEYVCKISCPDLLTYVKSGWKDMPECAMLAQELWSLLPINQCPELYINITFIYSQDDKLSYNYDHYRLQLHKLICTFDKVQKLYL